MHSEDLVMGQMEAIGRNGKRTEDGQFRIDFAGDLAGYVAKNY